MYTCIYTRVYLYIYTCILVYIHVYTCIYIHTRVYLYIFVYIYRYIASSGKDRILCIYEHTKIVNSNTSITSDHTYTYEHLVTVRSAHKRIVWDLW